MNATTSHTGMATHLFANASASQRSAGNCHTASRDQISKVTVGELVWNIRTTGTGPCCLLIHGTGASIHTWNNLVPFLSPHFTLVMMDLPGHAQTGTPIQTDLSLPGMSASIHQLIEHLGIRPSLIVGHSAGAAIMMQLCLQYKQLDASLVSINGAVVPLGGIAGYVFSPLARMSAAGSWMSHFFAFRARNQRNVKKLLDSTGSTIDEQSFQHYARLFQQPDHVAGVLRMMANWRLEKLLPHLGRLGNPVQLVAADCDKTIPLRDAYRLNQLLKQSSLSVIKNKGHMVHEEDPASVARIILEYVQQIHIGEANHANP